MSRQQEWSAVMLSASRTLQLAAQTYNLRAVSYHIPTLAFALMTLLRDVWCSHCLRVLLLSSKIYVIALPGVTISLIVFSKYHITMDMVVLILSIIVLFWNIISTMPFFNVPLAVFLSLHVVELGLLAFSLRGWLSFFMVIPLAWSATLFVLKIMDAITAPIKAVAFSAPYSPLPLKSDYHVPRWEKSLRVFLGSSQLRIVTSKLIIAVATMSIIGTLSYWKGEVKLVVFVDFCVILAHHLLSFFVTPILHRPIDVVLCFFELIFLDTPNESHWALIPWVLLIILFYSTLVTRIWDLVFENHQEKWRRFDIMGFDRPYVRPPRVSLFLGRKAWHELSLRGEHALVKFIRATLAILALGALILLTVVLVVRGVDSASHESALKTFGEDMSGQRFGVPRVYINPLLDGLKLDTTACNVTQICWHFNGTAVSGKTSTCFLDTDPKYLSSFLC
ncbi:hypothetical protein DL96DRAFT_1586847, partial [Flagelloscypha sp. PMI_526]